MGCFGNFLKSLYSLWNICIYAPFFKATIVEMQISEF